MPLHFHDLETALNHIKALSNTPDCDIDLYDAALALSFQNNPQKSLSSYLSHKETLKKDLEETYATIGNNDLNTKAHALRTVMAQKHGYIGDELHYTDPQNTDLMRTVDRRMGLPITLCIIAIQTARAMGWDAFGLNFPGHFLMRLDHEGERAVIDPFQGCKILQAPDLRKILKQRNNETAELSSNYYTPCTNRDTLLRLQNNIKFRQIDDEEYVGALETIQTMRMIAPDDYRLDLDEAILLARLDQPMAAVNRLINYITVAPDPQDRAEAEAFLHDLRSLLN